MKYSLLICAMVVSHMVHGQSFFKSVPKVETYGRYRAALAGTVDSTLNAWRPITNIAAYAEPGNILMAGAGISYQHLLWNAATAKWNCQWSISGMMWAGGSVAPSTPAQAISYGLMLGLFNNLIMVGPALNGNKVQAVLAVGISLNN